MLTVGDRFPEFQSQACISCDPVELGAITHESHPGKWKVYFFYPKDFTFVCPTELCEFANQHEAFAERDAVLISGSTDNEYSHLAWRENHPDLKDLPYPMIGAQKLAADLGILDRHENVCLRATFIVDPEGIIQWVSVYPLPTGRNVAEVLRALDAIQTGELTACDWKKGEPVLNPAG